MTPDDERHGEYRGWAQHYRDGEDPCDECLDARRTYGRTTPHLTALGKPPRVPVGRKAHTTTVELADLTEREWRDHTGASAVTRRRVLAGGPATRVRRSTRRMLEQVNPERVRADLLTIVGCIRRIQALACLGHSATAVAEASGVHPQTVRKIQSGALEYVEYETRNRIAATYVRLELMRLPVTNITARTFNLAERAGWVAPAGWDRIDDPAERPNVRVPRYQSRDEIDHAAVERFLAGEDVPTTPAEKREITARWVARGRTLNELERRTGWNVARMLREMKAAS